MGRPKDEARWTLFANGQLLRLVAAHLLAVVAEYAAVVGVLVYAFERGGARATGLASLAILAPTVIGAPITAALTSRFRPTLVRQLGLAVQAAGYGVAAGAAAAELPVAWVVAAAVVALGAVTTLRPTGAVLAPAVVRSTSELTIASLRFAHCESAGALAGPLAAAGLLSFGGPATLLGGCALAGSAALLTSSFRSDIGPPAPTGHERSQPGQGLAGAITSLRGRRWAVGVLGVTLARYVLLGALDVLLVVLAYDALDLGRGGAGLLNALVGVGAVVSVGVGTMVVRRARLAPWLTIALMVSATLCLTLGAATTWPVAVIVLPTLGLAAALIDGLGRMLLQRSADPRRLGPLFALVELVGGIGLLAGSGLTQLLIAVGDVQLALYGLAGVLAAVLLITGRAVWHADGAADLPVVEMSLLRTLPMFAPLPPLALEAVARSAEPVIVRDGVAVVQQGEVGAHFYAVSDGEFDIVMSGEHIRTAARGSFFGEVALLADVPRTATVTARGAGRLLAVERVPFLVAVTGSDTSAAAAWGVVRSLHLEFELPEQRPS